MEVQILQGKRQFWGFRSHWKAYGDFAALYAKTVESIEMPFGGWLKCAQPFIRWDQGRTNTFAAARGDKTAMRPFVKQNSLITCYLKMPYYSRHAAWSRKLRSVEHEVQTWRPVIVHVRRRLHAEKKDAKLLSTLAGLYWRF